MIIIKGTKESIRNESSCGLDGDSLGSEYCHGSITH